jgi:hypothetical protein
MYLSTATLVVVPKHLVVQWQGEIMKHCKDEAVRVLRVGREWPDVRTLASEYDVSALARRDVPLPLMYLVASLS